MTGTTLPASSGGYEMTRFNALQHGVLSRYTVLPWENADEYRALLAALVAEHAPRGPTEEHLVEELAGILWRKRRLRLAEAAAHRRGLEVTLAPGATRWRQLWSTAMPSAVRGGRRCATQNDTDEDMAELDEDEAMTRRALDLLSSGGRTWERTRPTRRRWPRCASDTLQCWEDQLTGRTKGLAEDSVVTAESAGLRDFLEGTILPHFAARRKELSNRC